MKSYDELMLTDDFLFCRILEKNPELCKELAGRIIGRKIVRIVTLQDQKTIQVYTYSLRDDHDPSQVMDDGTHRVLFCLEGNQQNLTEDQKQLIACMTRADTQSAAHAEGRTFFEKITATGFRNMLWLSFASHKPLRFFDQMAAQTRDFSRELAANIFRPERNKRSISPCAFA